MEVIPSLRACWILLMLKCASSFSLPSDEHRTFRDLAVTLPDPLRPFTLNYWFNELPLTDEDALKLGWKPGGSGCGEDGEGSSSSYYAGKRLFPPREPSIALLYDHRGTCAGLQVIYDAESLVLGSNHSDCRTWMRHKNGYDFASQRMINIENIGGRSKFVLTAYFYEPSKICTSIRDPNLIRERGFGKILYLQNGPTPSEFLIAPRTRSEAASRSWDNSRCLPLNGYHNFLNSSQWDRENCTQNAPVWLFYDEFQQLSGFGFTLPGCDPSPRFQHPPGFIVEYVSGSSCARRLADTLKFSNINVYLVPVKNTFDDCIVDVFGIRARVKQLCGFSRSLSNFCRAIFH